MTRTKQEQSKHDAKVEQIAKNLQKQGYKVAADVKGFKQPDTMGGVRPDVVATKPGERKIIEVETPQSVDSARDKRQQEQFKKIAAGSKKTTFSRRIAK